MKEQIKKELEILIQDIIDDKNIELNQSHFLAFELANFIVKKEDIIKKEDIPGSERIIFDINTYEGSLPIIEQIANYVRICGDTKEFTKGPKKEVLLEGNISDLNINTIKDNLRIVHQIRNDIAHGNYEIHSNFLETTGKIKCTLPWTLIRDFNQHIIKEDPAFNIDDVLSISEIFDQYQTNNYFARILGMRPECTRAEILHIALYSYALLTFSDIEKNINSYSNLSINSLYLIEPQDEYINKCEKIKRVLNEFQDDITKKIQNYQRCSDEEAKERIESSIQKEINEASQGVDELFFGAKDTAGSKIRNAVLHGNYIVGRYDNILMYDKNNQADEREKNFPVGLYYKDFFNQIKNINNCQLQHNKINDIIYMVSNVNNLKEVTEFLREILKHSSAGIDIDDVYSVLSSTNNLIKIIENNTSTNKIDRITESVQTIIKLIVDNKNLHNTLYDMFLSSPESRSLAFLADFMDEGDLKDLLTIIPPNKEIDAISKLYLTETVLLTESKNLLSLLNFKCLDSSGSIDMETLIRDKEQAEMKLSDYIDENDMPTDDRKTLAKTVKVFRLS